MLAVQLSQPPGPPGGTDGLHGALVVELVLPVDSQVGRLPLLTVLRILQTLTETSTSRTETSMSRTETSTSRREITFIINIIL